MKAIQYEIDKKYIDAINEYECEIVNNPNVGPESFINLSFLYWNLGFEYFEFVLPNQIPTHFCEEGGRKYTHVIDEGILKFPRNLELHFWKKYLDHISYGNIFTEKECLELYKLYDETSDIPYFFLYLTNNEVYYEKAKNLLKKLKKKLTAKNLYIISILSDLDEKEL